MNVTLWQSTFCFNDGKRQWLCATTGMCVVCSKVIQLRNYRSCSLFPDCVSHIHVYYFYLMLNKYKIFKNPLQPNKQDHWTLISAFQSCAIRRYFDTTLDRFQFSKNLFHLCNIENNFACVHCKVSINHEGRCYNIDTSYMTSIFFNNFINHNEIIWNANLMQQGDFINVFLARHVAVHVTIGTVNTT